jgi:hypothetical protein
MPVQQDFIDDVPPLGRLEDLLVVMVALEDHIQVVLVVDVLDPVCVHTLISVERLSSHQSLALCLSYFHNTDTLKGACPGRPLSHILPSFPLALVLSVYK